MSAKPEWEVLADLALRRLEKDYQRTLQATPIVRFKEGDIVSLAGMSTAILEGAKGTVVGAMDPVTLRYPIRLSAPEVPRCRPHCARAVAQRCNAILHRLLCLLTPTGSSVCKTASLSALPAAPTCFQSELGPKPLIPYFSRTVCCLCAHSYFSSCGSDDNAASDDGDSSGDDWEAPRAVEGHSTYATSFRPRPLFHSA
jgi:hypothetical protein